MARDPKRLRLRPMYGSFVARDDSVKQLKREMTEVKQTKKKKRNKIINGFNCKLLIKKKDVK